MTALKAGVLARQIGEPAATALAVPQSSYL
jgi:hypothetical protein